MLAFDLWLTTALNALVGRSWTFDTFLLLCVHNLVVKAGVVALLPWAWFRHVECPRRPQSLVLFGVVAALASVILARLVADLLPYRVRPLNLPGLFWHRPEGFHGGGFVGWSSFPSDHAALYGTLAGILFVIARPVGTFALAYALLLIDLPRVILGIHYPSDIVAGTALGLGCAALGTVPRLRDSLAAPLFRVRERAPGLFYAGGWLLLFGLAAVFAVLDLLRLGGTMVHAVLHRLTGG